MSAPLAPQEPARIIVADDDPLARRVVKTVLQAAGMTVIAEAKTGREAVELVLYYRPDVVIMDVVMPELDGILATREILKELPAQLVVVLTAEADEVELGLRAVEAGAVGFLSKEIDVDALPRTIAAVRAGEAAISRRLTRHLLRCLRRAPGGAGGLRPIRSPLTAREWEIVDQLKPDVTTDAIAEQLVVSTETVRSHIKNIMRKLEVHSRAEAVAAAERMRSAAPGPPR